MAHLAEHEYDPNCNFCMNNVFVKDAKETEKKLEQQGNQLETLNILHTALITQLDDLAGVEDQFRQWKEWTDEHKRLISLRERLEGEVKTSDSKIELLQLQLESVKADIQRYNDNEETITNNQALDVQIQNVRRLKQGVETQISDVNKLMLRLMSEVGATKTFIDNMKDKIRLTFIIFITYLVSDSERIRTFDPQLRRLLLYPTELLIHHILYTNPIFHFQIYFILFDTTPPHLTITHLY